MLFSSDDVQMTLPDYLGFSMPHGGTALTSATRPRAAATPRHVAAPRPPHMAARQSLIGERTGPTPTKLGDGGASPPGTACSVPGKGADPRGGRGFQHLWSWFPYRGLFFYPVFWVFRGWNIPPPRRFSYPNFWSEIRALDSVCTERWFESHVLLLFCFVFIYLFCFVFISSLLCMVLFFFCLFVFTFFMEFVLWCIEL